MLKAEIRKYDPVSAVIFYADGYSGPVFAMLHDIWRGDGWQIGSGQPLSRRQLAEALELLSGGGGGMMDIDPRLLAIDQDRGLMVWWEPERTDVIYCVLGNKQKTAMVRWPALVFATDGQRLMVLALGKNERPDNQTELFNAPFGNVFGHHGVCLGNSHLPASVSPTAIDGFSDVFYKTAFTHPNGCHDLLKGVDRQKISEWWIARDGKCRFPYSKLVPAGITLGDLKGMLVKDGSR